MKIKDEYKGKTLISYDSILGERRIEVDKIDPKRFTYYTSIGLGYLFEKESQTISYTGIDHEVAQADAVEEPKPVIKKTRKRRKDATTN
jgi:hypothetical protein